MYYLIEFIEFYITNLFRRKRNLQHINDLRRFLRTIPSLNSGGCGISALVMFRWIKKYHGEETTIVFGYNDDNADGFTTNENARTNQSEGTSAPTHALLKITDGYFDSHGKWSGIDYTFHHSITEELLVRAINDANNWNKTFKRKLYLPQINKFVASYGIDLSDIK